MSDSPDEPLWIFGYGSLVWRPAFPFAELRPARLPGWSRRFWQGSTDHRGIPGAPGRVVTLVPDPPSECWGVAYRVHPADGDQVLAQLDHREKGGYDRLEVDLHGRTDASFRGVTYLATPENPNYLGPAPLAEIAVQVRRSRGPSGANLEYVTRLAEALRELEAVDDHVFALAALLEAR